MGWISVMVLAVGCSLVQIGLRQALHLYGKGQILQLPIAWSRNGRIAKIAIPIIFTLLVLELAVAFLVLSWWAALTAVVVCYLISKFVIVSMLLGELNPVLAVFGGLGACLLGLILVAVQFASY